MSLQVNDNMEVTVYTRQNIVTCSSLIKTRLINVVLPTFFVVFSNIVEPAWIRYKYAPVEHTPQRVLPTFLN